MATLRVEEREDGRLHLRWYSADSDEWHEILEDFKDCFFGRTRRFDPQTKFWSVPISERFSLEDWAREWFESYQQTWVDRPPRKDGSTSQQREWAREKYQYNYRWETPPPPPRLDTSLDDAYQMLCLTRDAPPDLVKAVYHFWARRLHPDTGQGDEQRMKQINNAMDCIKAQTERRKI